MDGIWHVLWTGCQWKSIERDWFDVSSSVLHERFQTWQQQGLFDKLFKRKVQYDAQEQRIGWKWQSVDSMMASAPLGGTQTGKNPTDRSKSGSKIHLLVDERGAPLAIFITGANRHDKWSVEDLVVSVVVKRPYSEQHFCGDKAYDSADIHQFIASQNYSAHIKHRRRRNEPKPEADYLGGEKLSGPTLGGRENLWMVGEATQYRHPLVQEIRELDGFCQARLCRSPSQRYFRIGSK